MELGVGRFKPYPTGGFFQDSSEDSLPTGKNLEHSPDGLLAPFFKREKDRVTVEGSIEEFFGYFHFKIAGRARAPAVSGFVYNDKPLESVLPSQGCFPLFHGMRIYS